jgi:hypothetical protein
MLSAHITCNQVCPTPLFHGIVDSTDSHDDDGAAMENNLAMKGPESSGEPCVALSLGSDLLDLLLCMDMQEPCVEGLRSENVSLPGNVFLNIADNFAGIHTFSWFSIPTPH